MDGSYALFERFAPLIENLQSSRLEITDLIIPEFRLQKTDHLEIYYAPFDYVNTAAKIALVGITPGVQQMVLAYQTAVDALHQGLSAPDTCRRVSERASFAGTMRKNLIAMLDGLGLAALSNIESCSELFNSASTLLHCTSAIRYAVFANGRNYTGHTPQVMKSPILRTYILSILLTELQSIPDALIVPLGSAVSEVLQLLAESQLLLIDRCLLGFPHPSGANGHRHHQYREHREEMRRRAVNWLGKQ